MVENCRVTHCACQGILTNDPDGEIADNYVDAIGGEVVDNSTARSGVTRLLEHDLYASGGGLLIHDNFLGRAAERLVRIQVARVTDTTATTLFCNNVCYGARRAGATWRAGTSLPPATC